MVAKIHRPQSSSKYIKKLGKPTESSTDDLKTRSALLYYKY